MFHSITRPQYVRWALFGFIFVFTHTNAALPGDTGQVKVGQVVPEVTMSGLNGPPRKLSSYRGKPLIINVWASWCTPCRAEAASLERFAWSEDGQPYTVIGISTDDDRAAAIKWLKQSNATLSHFIDAHVELENLLGAHRIPLTVLVDANGRIVDKFRGAREWDDAASARWIHQAFGTVGREKGRRP